MPIVFVPAIRFTRFMANFTERHGQAALEVNNGALHAHSPDGSSLDAHLPFSITYAGPPQHFAQAARPPDQWGLLLVRKGGFAVAQFAGEHMVAHHIGRRHVQGRTAAGGQSQQRFARRRENQARAAFQAAAEHAAQVLTPDCPLVVGGDKAALTAVLAHDFLRSRDLIGPFLPAAEPRRATLDQAARDAQSLVVDVRNAVEPPVAATGN